MNAFSMVLVQSVGRLHLVHFLTHLHRNTGTNRTRWGTMTFQRQAQLIAVFTTAGRESRVSDCSLDSGLFSCQSTSIYKNWQHSGDTCFDESETSFFAPIKTKFCGFQKNNKHSATFTLHPAGTASLGGGVRGQPTFSVQRVQKVAFPLTSCAPTVSLRLPHMVEPNTSQTRTKQTFDSGWYTYTRRP